MREIDRDTEKGASAITAAVCAVCIIIIAVGAVITRMRGKNESYHTCKAVPSVSSAAR